MNITNTSKKYYALTDEQKLRVCEDVAKDSAEFLKKLDEPLKPNGYIYRVIVRRIIDIIFSAFILIITLPINLILAIATYIDVGSPILFKQERVGENGKVFNLYKFRNMTNETNENGVLLPPEQRVTKLGKFVRKTSLDELLNFWSILLGNMTIIGPRPLPLKYASRYSAKHNQRHLIKPGLECPFHNHELADKGWEGRFENDLWYVKNISFKVDVFMLFRFVKKVFSKSERKTSATGGVLEFIGYTPDGDIIHAGNLPEKYLDFILQNEKETEELAETVS